MKNRGQQEIVGFVHVAREGQTNWPKFFKENFRLGNFEIKFRNFLFMGGLNESE